MKKPKKSMEKKSQSPNFHQGFYLQLLKEVDKLPN